MSEDPVEQPDAARELLRHTVATLAYRAEKVLREVPEGFAEFRLSANGRTALEILGHLADLMEWGIALHRRQVPVATGRGDVVGRRARSVLPRH